MKKTCTLEFRIICVRANLWPLTLGYWVTILKYLTHSTRDKAIKSRVNDRIFESREI